MRHHLGVPRFLKSYPSWSCEDGQTIIQTVATAVILGVLALGAYYLTSSLFDTNASSQSIVNENNSFAHIHGFLSSKIGLVSPCALGQWNMVQGTNVCTIKDADSSPVENVSLAGDQLFLQDGSLCYRIYYVASAQELDYAQGSNQSECSASFSSSIFPRRGPNQQGGPFDPVLDSTSPPDVLATGVINSQDGQSTEPIFTYLDALGQPLDVWLANARFDTVDRLLPGGQILAYPLASGAQPQAITQGSDGNLWFTEYGANEIGCMTEQGTPCFGSSTNDASNCPIPTANSGPFGITSAPDGLIYFTESNANQIGIFDPKGSTCPTINEYAVPTANAQPYDIAVGTDGKVYFTEHSGRVATIAPDGTITEGPSLTGDAPGGITSGPDGKLWISLNPNTVGYMPNDVTQSPTSIAIPSNPGDITSGPDGNIWVSEASGDLAQISPSSFSVTEHSVGSNALCALDNAPDGLLWYEMCSGDEIGTYDIATGSSSSYDLGSGGTATPFGGLQAITSGGPDAFASSESTNAWYDSASDGSVVNVNAVAAVKVTVTLKIGTQTQTKSFIIPLSVNGSGESLGEYLPTSPPPYATAGPTIEDGSTSSTSSFALGDTAIISNCGAWTPSDSLSGGNCFNQGIINTYQWQECASTTQSSCTNIIGATASSVVPNSSEIAPGDYLQLVLTAANADGAGSPAISNQLKVQ